MGNTDTRIWPFPCRHREHSQIHIYNSSSACQRLTKTPPNPPDNPTWKCKLNYLRTMRASSCLVRLIYIHTRFSRRCSLMRGIDYVEKYTHRRPNKLCSYRFPPSEAHVYISGHRAETTHSASNWWAKIAKHHPRIPAAMPSRFAQS